MSNAATEPLSVANVWVPPPRNKKPIAMPMAMCAPWDSPEAPPPPDAASSAAAAAAPAPRVQAARVQAEAESA